MTISTGDEIHAAADAIKADGPGAPTAGRDPINQPMIHNWVEVMGDENPIYVDESAARAAGHPGIVAPPAMAQVWTMRGLHGRRTADDPLARATEMFDEAGYTSVVATNCDTVYHRYTRPGEEVTLSAELTDVAGPKNTALGEGWFFTTRNVWSVGDEVVAEMSFRILKFRPPEQDDAAAGDAEQSSVPDDLDPSRMLRPSSSRDTGFFWQGVAAHELRIQQLEDGSLRHPPIPAIWKARQSDGTVPQTDYVVASGRGTVFSHVVHHAPKVPGRQLPFVVALVELEEGVRMLGELRGIAPEQVRIGLPVEVTFLDFPADDDTGTAAWSLYAWTPIDTEEQK
ncbi:bifunctional MaoC family dehydratase N-terminal/OB-fold nucleic acid binding domain-containing protein [Gordonia sp. ABSL11-1]|uniref:bifunctional MaoC family dehydratase N-terminal/OB-fold nucleic acid binding domain-containing protein n=1 Tax=Gordonia sp. ABSL11-1 TaxID=3053924 RepID=UPI002572F10D|nr:bifunctional MaoC family dehydratase N-terminal/OB-fold nucleic acid binding domain-containing protein [Gordonia sp. ABSL11-1]MDL9945491.1 bifunctional MaoC family dehydratase N-terminal/OB-fold nucleic acid binding domain-containing protein [Gordonia sp. ABSL11-1]